jgi:hypothetical protein
MSNKPKINKYASLKTLARKLRDDLVQCNLDFGHRPDIFEEWLTNA